MFAFMYVRVCVRVVCVNFYVYVCVCACCVGHICMFEYLCVCVVYMANIHQDSNSIKNMQMTFLKSFLLYSFV